MAEPATIIEQGKWVGAAHAKKKKRQKRKPKFGYKWRGSPRHLGIQVFGEKLRKRNIFKHIVILKEYLTPQYGYYGFALLGNIYKNHVFGVWVRENCL